MNSIPFAIDWQLLPLTFIFAMTCYLLWRFQTRYQIPQILVSDFSSFSKARNWRTLVSGVMSCLKYIGFAVLLLAFVDPRFYVER